MLPALRSAIKDFFSGFGTQPVQLDLETKSAGGVSFDAINVGWYARNGYPGLYSILSGGLPAWSGENVSVETATNHSVVYACTALIAETIGFIPTVMMQSNKDGSEKRDAFEHPMYRALQDETSCEMTAMTFQETLTANTLLQGNGYARIIRRSGTGAAIELHPLLPSQVLVDREKKGKKRLVYVVKNGNDPDTVYAVERGKPQDILHIKGLGDGLRGWSVLTLGRNSIGTAIATERNIARFYANGGRLPYVLEMEQKFKNDQDFDKFRTEWEKTYAEPHRAPIMEQGMHYKQIGLNAADAQMLQTRLFNIHEICRWFRVSPHLVGDLSRATFSNIESLALEFVKMTLSTWITRWEKELKRCVLTDEEKAKGYFFKHNLNALLRGDFASRMQGYSQMLQNGIASIDEVRNLEDWNPAADGVGQNYHIQLNQQTLTGDPLPQALKPQPALAGKPDRFKPEPDESIAGPE